MLGGGRSLGGETQNGRQDTLRGERSGGGETEDVISACAELGVYSKRGW